MRARILVVDDDREILEIACLLLGGVPDWQIEGVSSGAEALHMARVRRPDLILLDVMMPGMDGPSVLAHVLDDSRLAMVPVVFMTAQPRDARRLLAAGAAAVLAKPFVPELLIGEIRGILESEAEATSPERPLGLRLRWG